jgi:hypothetical protein
MAHRPVSLVGAFLSLVIAIIAIGLFFTIMPTLPKQQQTLVLIGGGIICLLLMIGPRRR